MQRVGRTAVIVATCITLFGIPQLVRIPPVDATPLPATGASCDANGCGGEGLDLYNSNTDTSSSSGDSGSTDSADSKSSSAESDSTPQCTPGKDPDCIGSLVPVSGSGAAAPTEPQLRTVATQLKLPNPTPRFGPDPSANEWKMLAVGYPIWLWTDRPTTITTTAHHDGLTFTLTATWTSTTFTMGDGHSKTCTATTIRPKTVKPATKPSPTCSYTYQTKSKPGHPYTVTANTHWQINWTTNGYQGTFTHTYTGSRTLEIGELQSLING